MNDTTPAAAALYSSMLMALPGERRLLMAMEMFDTARAFVLASLPAGLSEEETMIHLCRRLYGEELAARYAAALKPGSAG